jgi:hypothetical protein
MAALRLASDNARLGDGLSQGWTFATEVKQSTIPGAGNGRFAVDTVKKDTLICCKPSCPAATLESLSASKLNEATTFTCSGDLERYVKLSEDAGFSREQTLDLYSNFIWSIDGELAWLNNSTWTINHANDESDGLNTCLYLEGGAICCKATRDIEAGVEIKMDYRTFQQAPFYLEYCEEMGMKDVRAMVMEAIGWTD